MKINPKIIIWTVILIPSWLINCGRNAMKNKDTFGFKTFIKNPFLINGKPSQEEGDLKEVGKADSHTSEDRIRPQGR